MPSFNLTYKLRQVSEDEFVKILKSAHQAGRLKSLIGYAQNAEYLTRKCGFKVEVNRDQCSVQGGDTLLIMRLPYRPSTISKGETVLEDFEYGVVEVV